MSLKAIALLLLLACGSYAETRYDKLARAYEAHPTQKTYDRLMKEWWRIEKRNREIEKRLPPQPELDFGLLDRTCDGDYDTRKMLNR